MDMSDLECIWNKWTDTPTPDDIAELMLNSKAVRDIVTMYLGLVYKSGQVPKEQVAEMGRSYGESLKYAMRGALILGLELAERMSGGRPSTVKDQNITLDLDFEEWTIIDACLAATKESLLRKSYIAQESLSTNEKMLVNRIEDVEQATQSQAQASSDYFPLHKVKSELDSSIAFHNLLSTAIRGVDSTVIDYILSQSD
jgi:hypothetical protein